MRQGYVLIMMVLSLILCTIAIGAYSNYHDNLQDKRWCQLLTNLDRPLPPGSPERSQSILKDIHNLRVDMNCGGQGEP